MLLGFVDGFFDVEEQGRQARGPGLLVTLGDELEFAQQVTIAQAMLGARVKVRGERIVDGRAFDDNNKPDDLRFMGKPSFWDRFMNSRSSGQAKHRSPKVYGACAVAGAGFEPATSGL